MKKWAPENEKMFNQNFHTYSRLFFGCWCVYQVNKQFNISSCYVGCTCDDANIWNLACLHLIGLKRHKHQQKCSNNNNWNVTNSNENVELKYFWEIFRSFIVRQRTLNWRCNAIIPFLYPPLFKNYSKNKKCWHWNFFVFPFELFLLLISQKKDLFSLSPTLGQGFCVHKK